MSCLRRRPCSPAVKTPLEDDDLLGEILLRLPPQPSSLPRASIVCKRWRGLASDPAFYRRFRRHHRHNPPLLGFFAMKSGVSFVPTLEAPNRVPPGRFSLQPGDGDGFRCLGCRHGLVLISNIPQNQLLVWDPVTGDQRRLTIPPGIAAYAEKTMVHGAVLRPAGEVDHFQVVLTAADNDDKQHRRALACVYSSETSLWGDLISTRLPSEVPMSHHPTFVFPSKTALLAGNSLYWMLVGNFDGILQFDLEKQSLAVIRVPVHMLEEGHYRFQIMRAEGGGLGLFFWLNRRLQLWKRNANADGVASWGLERTIELDKLLPLNSWSPTRQGFAEDNNVIFLLVGGVYFMVHLESLQLKKLLEANSHTHYPFEIVYTAGIGDEHDAADLLRHTG